MIPPEPSSTDAVLRSDTKSTFDSKPKMHSSMQLDSLSDFYGACFRLLDAGESFSVGTEERPAEQDGSLAAPDEISPSPEHAKTTAMVVNLGASQAARFCNLNDFGSNSFDTIRKSPSHIGIETSGTTGRPKLIWHDIGTLTRTVKVSDARRLDRWGFGYSPTSFAGLQVFFQAIANLNPICALSLEDPARAVEQIDEYELTHLSGTPTFFRILCQSRLSCGRVTSVTIGGERCDANLTRLIKASFPQARVRNIYASTELGALLVASDDCFVVPEDLTDKIRVLNGELAVHRSLLAVSLKSSVLSHLHSHDHAVSDPFYRTGDLVEVLDSNPLRFRFSGRRNDWINVGGFKVNPATVEQELEALAQVAHARVFGKKNSVIGNLVCAEIVPAIGQTLTTTSIKSALRDRLPKHEVPQLISIVDRIRTNSTGKKPR